MFIVFVLRRWPRRRVRVGRPATRQADGDAQPRHAVGAHRLQLDPPDPGVRDDRRAGRRRQLDGRVGAQERQRHGQVIAVVVHLGAGAEQPGAAVHAHRQLVRILRLTLHQAAQDRLVGGRQIDEVDAQAGAAGRQRLHAHHAPLQRLVASGQQHVAGDLGADRVGLWRVHQHPARRQVQRLADNVSRLAGAHHQNPRPVIDARL